jgi:chlorosome envelope protein B
MSNGTSNDLSGAITNLMDTLGKLGQQQVEMLNSGIKTASQMIEPLAKTATDLAGNLVNTANQVLQSVSAAVAPKK